MKFGRAPTTQRTANSCPVEVIVFFHLQLQQYRPAQQLAVAVHGLLQSYQLLLKGLHPSEQIGISYLCNRPLPGRFLRLWRCFGVRHLYAARRRGRDFFRGIGGCGGSGVLRFGRMETALFRFQFPYHQQQSLPV